MRYYLGLGSNLGNRLGNLQAAARCLAEAGSIAAVASLYESEPVGPAGQPPYWNTALALDADLAPRALLRLVKGIEWRMGRRPGERWGPRPLDIDLLLADELRLAEPDLVLPHPHMAERPFVLVPLAEIAGDTMHPVLGRRIRELRDTAGTAGLARIAEPHWTALRYLRVRGLAGTPGPA